MNTRFAALTLVLTALFSTGAYADTPTDQLDGSGRSILAEAFYGEGGVLSSADDTSFDNTSYLVIDWFDGPSVTYGYRWSTQGRTGEQLFADVVQGTLNNPNDEELYSKQQTFTFGGVSSQAIQGIGYNRDGDSDFGDLSDGTTQSNFVNNSGILGGVDAVDGVTAFDLEDSYAEGFFGSGGTWQFSVAGGNPYDGTSAWTDSQTGITDRILTDNSWDGWAFGVPDFSGAVGEAGADFRPRASVVPEPSSMLLLGLSGLAVAGRRRRS